MLLLENSFFYKMDKDYFTLTLQFLLFSFQAPIFHTYYDKY